MPSLVLPPEDGALADTHFNAIFTRSVEDLSKAHWAIVSRDDYLRIVKERKGECTAFANVVVDEEAANSRMPEQGVPVAIQACAVRGDGVDNAPVCLEGPASKAADLGKDEDAGEESEPGDSEGDSANEKRPDRAETDYLHESVASATVALDPVQQFAPVRSMQAIQARIDAAAKRAKVIARNETAAKVADNEGLMQTVADEGGRDHMKPLVLDLQTEASAFDHRQRAPLEQAVAGSERCRAVTPQALAIPTHGPMDSFDARTWPAAYVEWWFGDGAPNLDRDRPMLFEEVARMLMDREELEYHLASRAMRVRNAASIRPRSCRCSSTSCGDWPCCGVRVPL